MAAGFGNPGLWADSLPRVLSSAASSATRG